jgi:glycerol-3-phosphate dehydrogenase (NAD(P)+)
MKTRIALLGGGSWGATLAALLAENGHAVTIWEFDSKAAESLERTRRLPVLPQLALPDPIRVTAALGESLERAELIVSAVPAQAARSTMKALRASGKMPRNVPIISVSKGLEDGSAKRVSEVITEETGLDLGSIAVLGGPSHAEEVCRHLPTATVLASSNRDLVNKGRQLFTNETMRVYAHTDMVGVELSGALKNVYAIACGISDGLGFGDNTRAAILTRGLNEMTRLGVRLGAQLLTFFGLAGMGDLAVTCMSQHSRNHALGEKIGKGLTPAVALSEMTMVAEGYKTAPSALRLAEELGLECPLTREIHEVLYGGKSPKDSLHDLMAREPQEEWQGLKHLVIERRSS